jgi:hypothetical protein
MSASPVAVMEITEANKRLAIEVAVAVVGREFHDRHYRLEYILGSMDPAQAYVYRIQWTAKVALRELGYPKDVVERTISAISDLIGEQTPITTVVDLAITEIEGGNKEDGYGSG